MEIIYTLAEFGKESKSMNIGICDDDRIYLDRLFLRVSSMLSDMSGIEINKMMPEDLVTLIQSQRLTYDILILDIDMGSWNGIELVKEIHRIHPDCIIIFISNHIMYATQVYDVDHVYFVLKGEEDERLSKAFDKAISVFEDRRSTYIELQYQGINYLISLAQVSHIEVFGRYLCVHSEDKTYKSIRTLKSIIPSLTSTFIRCHKSIVVNLNYVYSVSRSICILKNDVQLPVSNTYYNSFMTAFRQFASNKLSL